MYRPEYLRKAMQIDPVADLLALMIHRETFMVCWMPVLRGNDQIEARLLVVGDRNHFIPPGHRQGATREEVILNVDENQRVHSSQSNLLNQTWEPASGRRGLFRQRPYVHGEESRNSWKQGKISGRSRPDAGSHDRNTSESAAYLSNCSCFWVLAFKISFVLRS